MKIFTIIKPQALSGRRRRGEKKEKREPARLII